MQKLTHVILTMIYIYIYISTTLVYRCKKPDFRDWHRRAHWSLTQFLTRLHMIHIYERIEWSHASYGPIETRQSCFLFTATVFSNSRLIPNRPSSSFTDYPSAWGLALHKYRTMIFTRWCKIFCERFWNVSRSCSPLLLLQ